MLKRFGLAIGLSGGVGVALMAMTFAMTEAELVAATPVCRVSNTTLAYNYGSPPTYVGDRDDNDSWRHWMNIVDCTSNLGQVRVKQWGAEVCAQMYAEYVILNWNWVFTDSGLNTYYGSLSQQYDCDDLP